MYAIVKLSSSEIAGAMDSEIILLHLRPCYMYTLRVTAWVAEKFVMLEECTLPHLFKFYYHSSNIYS